MIRILSEQLVQDRPGLELLRIRFIGRIGRAGDSQRIKNGRFGVLGVSGTESGHCVFISQLP